MEHKLPMSGIRVLDFTWVAAGPRTTLPLANMGAEVIKVESARRLDLSRGRPPFAEGKSGINAGANWVMINADKLSITLNMTKPRAVEIANRLVAVSDIVIDNMTGGVMERWGMGYQSLVKIKPDIIVVSMPVMGTTGPYKEFGGYLMGVEAIGGIKQISGFPSRMPVGTGFAFPDSGPNPAHAAVAILAALHYKNKTGKGQYIEISQYESTICWTGTAILEYNVNKNLQPRLGNHLAYASPHGTYRCKGNDEWCVIGIFNEKEWGKLIRAMGSPSWTKDPKFATMEERKKNEDQLDLLITELTLQHTREEVWALQKEGISVGMVQNARDILEDPHLKARNYFRYVDNSEAGLLPCFGPVARLSALEERVPSPAPLFGEHNDRIFGGLLGMSEEEINQLIVEEVIY